MRFAIVVVLLCAIPSLAQDKPKAPLGYIKVEMRGTLRIVELVVPPWFEMASRSKVKATVKVPGMALPLAVDDKDLADLAKKLDRKTVLVVGYLSRSSDPHITVQPTQFVYFYCVCPACCSKRLGGKRLC
jgi:hypothetical protein